MKNIIDINATAKEIVEYLKECSFDNVTDSSGYYIIKEIDDKCNRTVDVYKSTFDGNEHYVVYCSYEDETGDYAYTEDLSVESLEVVLSELAQAEIIEEE